MKSTLFRSVRLFASRPCSTEDYVRLSNVFVTHQRANTQFLLGILALGGAAVVANHWLSIELGAIEVNIGTLRASVHDLKADVHDLKVDMRDLKADVHDLNVDMRDLKADVGALKADLATLLSRLPPK